MKKIVGIFLGIAFLAVAGVALASPENQHGKAATPPFPQPAESKLQKVIFVRYAPGKEPNCDNDGVCEPRENWKNCPHDCPKGEEEPTPSPEETACYDFLAGSKPKWNWIEDYTVSETNLATTSAWATGVWNEAIPNTIFGTQLPGNYQWGIYDYQNSISYGDYGDPNVIAVTAIWFRGKNIYEYDIMFDQDYFPGDGSIDLDTVALHEFGHGAGLDDLYDVVCSEEVMYGIYAGVKRELRNGDIIGIQTLYGQ